MQRPEKINVIQIASILIIISFLIAPLLGVVIIVLATYLLIKNPKLLKQLESPDVPEIPSDQLQSSLENRIEAELNPNVISQTNILSNFPIFKLKKVRLEKRKKYLHIALNSTLEEAREIISRLPFSDRILIEVGTPLIKTYGTKAISEIKKMTPSGTYIVADNKCADLATREVELMANAGANASTCLGVAPIETIDSFIEECAKFNIDSMIDMMNVDNSLAVLKKLKKLPDVVMLHRGVDESEFSKEKQIPYYQIKQIKGNFNVLVAVAGGDEIREVQRAIFNDADIVVVWKGFYKSNADTAGLAGSFLKEIR